MLSFELFKSTCRHAPEATVSSTFTVIFGSAADDDMPSYGKVTKYNTTHT